ATGCGSRQPRLPCKALSELRDMALQALLDAAIRPKTLNLRVGAPVLLGDQLLDELTPASHHEVELRGLLIGQRRNPWLQRCSKLSQAGCVHLVGLGQAV